MSLWDFVPVGQFESPPWPANEEARGGLRRALRWWRREVLGQAPPSENDSSQDVYSELRPQQARRAAGRIRWEEASLALESHLADWLETPDAYDSPRVLLGPPGCDVAAMLRGLAERRGLPVVSAPSVATLAELQDESSLRQLREVEADVVVAPEQQRMFLRHERGLAWVRRLLQALAMRRRVLVGCGSWAWAFLQEAAGAENLLGAPLTLAPLDAQRVDAWLRRDCGVEDLLFRRAHGGGPVFPEPASDAESKTEDAAPEPSSLIRSLAAIARGNPAVALEIWRRSLRARDEEDKEEPSQDADRRNSVWVVAPTEIQLPELPPRPRSTHFFLLHYLLIHDGLTWETLQELLHFTEGDLRRRLSELQACGVVIADGDRWRVSLAAYPQVRRELMGEGFLADAL